MDRVGRYELHEQIGEGAMAEVWRAHDPSIDRVLAIKLLRPEFRSSVEYSARFLREARAAGVLSHPAIVTIYDVGEADGVAYIAMELLDGEPLDALIARQDELSTETIMTIGAQLAGALSYAHRAGVIHRDIKPSNVMLLADRRSIKILDFGIARVADKASADPDENARTQIGQVIGTPRYMSPEQALGRELDGRSDLFSTGVLLYELITRQAAFSGPSAAALALRITQQNPTPIAELAPHCPGGLRFIVDKLLAKRPERRFGTGDELVKALERETKAYGAVQADQAARGRLIPVQVRVSIATVMIMALSLFFGINAVLTRQYQAMEQMALSSGSSIAAFVASNAALPSVENASAPENERDWLPIQAFITAAANDSSVRWMTMVDADGFIRGSSDPKLLGKPYRTPGGEAVVYRGSNVTVTDIRLADGRAGYRFVQPILYAGKKFGMIEVSISKDGLETAAARSRGLLIGLGALIVAIVGGLSFAIAKYLARPLRRVKDAMLDATMGNLDFRISHHRKDEFGQLFDTFNLFANAMQERLDAADRGSGGPRSMEATRVNSPFESETPQSAPPTAATPQRARA